jgi:hypothetical protein
VAVALASSPALGVRVAVRANATLEARVTNDGDAQVIRGTLKDDVGTPVVAAHVEIEILGADGKRLDLPAPRPCGATAGGHPPHAAPDAYVLDTDARGMFCARTAPITTRGTLRVRFAGQGAIAATSVEIPFDAEQKLPTMTWEGKPDTLDLDLAQLRLSVVATGRVGGRGLDGIALSLLDERGQTLSRARTDERGRASFEIATASLDGPGAGELSVRTEAAGPPLLSARVLRVARVGLVVAPPGDAIVPHDGHTFTVAVETGRGPSSTGAVEARVGEESVGVGTVKSGRAAVTVTFDVPSEGALDLSFRYLTSSPELRAGDPVTLRVPVRPPPAWRRAPLFLVAILLVAWIARGWRRAPRSAEAARRSLPPPARLPEMVAEPDAKARDWHGVVLDAHDRRPIEGAIVRLLARDFRGEHVTAQATTARDGSFILDGAATPTSVIEVEARFHARLEKPAPGPGRVTLALVSRRRALLDRLVHAARRTGFAGAAPPDPTPAHVARQADARSRHEMAGYARAVEAAAYGESPVDAGDEQRVVALEPRDAEPPRLPNVR